MKQRGGLLALRQAAIIYLHRLYFSVSPLFLRIDCVGASS